MRPCAELLNGPYLMLLITYLFVAVTRSGAGEEHQHITITLTALVSVAPWAEKAPLLTLPLPRITHSTWKKFLFICTSIKHNSTTSTGLIELHIITEKLGSCLVQIEDGGPLVAQTEPRGGPFCGHIKNVE